MNSMIDPITISEGFTQSELETLDTCGYKWFLKYNLRLRRKGSYSWPLVFGSAFHTTLEQMYSTKGKRWEVAKIQMPSDVVLTGGEQEEYNYWQGLLEVTLQEYYEYWKNDFKVFRIEPDGIEHVADITINFDGINIRLKGMLDLFGMFGRTYKMQMDHKTTSRLSSITLEGWDFRFQFMFYVWLCQHIYGEDQCKGFAVNAIKKTELRQKKDESLQAFLIRVKNDIKARPEEYFYRNYMTLDKPAMRNFEEHTLMPKLMKLATIIDPDSSHREKTSLIFNRNTNACFNYNSKCEFFPICSNGYKSEIHQYEQREVKHTELSEE